MSWDRGWLLPLMNMDYIGQNTVVDTMLPLMLCARFRVVAGSACDKNA